MKKSAAPPVQSPESLLAQAMAWQKKGELDKSARYCRRLLELQGDHAEANHLLGVIHLIRGETQEGIDRLRAAIAAAPQPHYHLNLGKALIRQGRRREGLASFAQLLTMAPTHLSHCRETAFFLMNAEFFPDAARWFNHILRLRENDVEVWNGLGVVYARMGQWDKGLSCLLQAIKWKPDYAKALSNLGSVCSSLGRLEESVHHLQLALRHDPEMTGAYQNLGNTLAKLDRQEEAVACYRQAIAREPEFAEARNSLGYALLLLGQLAEAEEHLRQAVRLAPGNHDAHFNLSLVLLLQGRLQEGWEAYEHRVYKQGFTRAEGVTDKPLWRGDPLGERVLLLWGEQGFGDKIQFVRYLPLLRRAFPEARLWLQCALPLWDLFAPLAATHGVRLVVEGLREGFDCQLPLLSLPHRLATRLETIPGEIPYLTLPESLRQVWRERLATLPHPRVGVAWAGSATNLRDRFRTLPEPVLSQLLAATPVQWISLQKEHHTAGALPPEGVVDWMPRVRDFADTAALILQLDLVISVDTAVAHLAAALGKPVWLLNRFDSDWRWLTQRTDSPWYPTLTLFRQPSPGDWPGVLQQVIPALQEWRAGFDQD